MKCSAKVAHERILSRIEQVLIDAGFMQAVCGSTMTQATRSAIANILQSSINNEAGIQ
ncbi:MAG: hypothetical protein WBN32_12260 [Woeseia sp.]